MKCKFTKTIHSNVYLNVFIIRMVTQTTPAEIYQQQVDFCNNNLNGLKRKRSRLGWLRLIIVLSILLLIYYLFFNSSVFVWITAAAGIVFFFTSFLLILIIMKKFQPLKDYWKLIMPSYLY
ncbi:MAG: hypothetical protein WKG06_35435 [Segetibacter sp.]